VRSLFVLPTGVVDSDTGEVVDMSLELLLTKRPGGSIVGRNLYPFLAPMVDDARRDYGWTATIITQSRQAKDDRVRGLIYFSHLTYRFAKIRRNGVRFRPGSIKWLVLNMELFTEDSDIVTGGRALMELASARGIRPRYSPGAFGAAMMRASPEYSRKRRPAPRFVSESARSNLPGNLYVLREGYRTSKRAYYLDQRSAHHSAACTVDLPHPHHLRARGFFRAVEAERFPPWLKSTQLLANHVGVIIARVECRHLGRRQDHLYPPWARVPGTHVRWIWTPELRLLDQRVQIQHVCAALTSHVPDPLLREYGLWSREYLSPGRHSAVKPALLAGYGMLAVRTKSELVKYSVHGRTPSRRAEVVTLPLLSHVYRTRVEQRRTPSLQNVVARGVIEAEVNTRSVEMARRLESQGIPALHIYADGVIAECDQLPFLPDGWRVVTGLTDVTSANPTSVVSREMVRLPGIPDGRRTAYIRKDSEGYHLREREPATIVR
jgi:hypothetical protein